MKWVVEPFPRALSGRQTGRLPQVGLALQGICSPKAGLKWFRSSLVFPFTAVKDFIFPYEPQLALRFKIFQPNSFTFFLNLKMIFFLHWWASYLWQFTAFEGWHQTLKKKLQFRFGAGDSSSVQWATSLLISHKSNKKINKTSSSDWMVPFNGLLTCLKTVVFIRALWWLFYE